MTDRIELDPSSLETGVPLEAFKALTFAFYSLHDLLVAQGVLMPGEAANNLRRFKAGRIELQAFVNEIAQNLETMPFKPQDGPHLQLVKDD